MMAHFPGHVDNAESSKKKWYIRRKDINAWQYQSCVLLRIKLQGYHNNVAVNGQRLQFCKEL